MRIALISLDQFWQDKTLNLNLCKDFLKKAQINRCDLIIFPEMTLTAFCMEREFINNSSENINNSVTMNEFASLAKLHNLNIIFGATLKDDLDDLPENSMCLAEPSNGAQKIYSKIHPFSFAEEEKVIQPGKNIGLFKLNDINFGASICYDLRFPTFFNIMNRDCECYICIANWPIERVNHWKSLLVARAIENQVYMIGVNRIGKDGNNLEYSKSSYVISPSGNILESVKIDQEMDIYEIEKDVVNQYRKEHPFIKDSKDNLYFKFIKTGK